MSSGDPSTEATSLPPQADGLWAGEDASKTISRTPFASGPWFRPKDPRVVRVSRALGGRDRHSKVYTIRGLRDRRVRLSVPTAIQLYNLQDRLGMSQPSKVVDWLLDAAKHEIDELPPLPMEPSHLGQPPTFHPCTSLPSLKTIQSLSSTGELGPIGGLSWGRGDDSSKPSRQKFLNSLDDALIGKNQGQKQNLDEGQVTEEFAPPSNFSSAATNETPNNFPSGSNIFHLEHSNVANFPHHGLIKSHSSSEDPTMFNLTQTHPYSPWQFMTTSGAEMDIQLVSPLQLTVASLRLQKPSSSSHLNSLTHQQSSG